MDTTIDRVHHGVIGRECDICGEKIEVEINGWAEGHNATPIVKDGRCCGDCNTTAVIPARLASMYGLFD